MKPTTLVLIVLTIMVIGLQINRSIQCQKISENLVMLIAKKKYDEVYESLDSNKVKRYIPAFNRYFLGMNAGIIQDNKEKVNKYFDMLLDRNLKVAESETVFMRGLEYFIEISDKDRCKICCENLQKSEMDSETKMYLNRIYDVMVLDKVDSLNELLKEIDNDNSSEVFTNEFLVSAIYKHLGNKEKEKKYKELAQKHLSNFIQSSANIEASGKTANTL